MLRSRGLLPTALRRKKLLYLPTGLIDAADEARRLELGGRATELSVLDAQRTLANPSPPTKVRE